MGGARGPSGCVPPLHFGRYEVTAVDTVAHLDDELGRPVANQLANFLARDPLADVERAPLLFGVHRATRATSNVHGGTGGLDHNSFLRTLINLGLLGPRHRSKTARSDWTKSGDRSGSVRVRGRSRRRCAGFASAGRRPRTEGTVRTTRGSASITDLEVDGARGGDAELAQDANDGRVCEVALRSRRAARRSTALDSRTCEPDLDVFASGKVQHVDADAIALPGQV